MNSASATSAWTLGSRGARWAVLLLGLVLGQFFLYGPSLVGAKILLPLDILALPDNYLPVTAETRKIVIHDGVLSDLVFQQEMLRQFAASELRAGRMPSWLPFEYAGAPMAWPKYSPFLLLGYSTPSPYVLAWVQLMEAIVAGVGMYLFCRRALGVRFWPAAVGAWCYPLTGFLVLNQGYPSCGSIYWFPWIMLAVNRAVHRPDWLRLAGVSGAVALVLVSGQLDIAAQVLLAAVLYGIWCVADLNGWGRLLQRCSVQRLAMLAASGILGLMLASPQVLPLLDYARTGMRVQHRVAGAEERPPGGLSELALTVWPDREGAMRTGSLWLGSGNQLESAAGAYAGVIATLFAAPLAWCSRRHRHFAWFCLGLSIVGVSWCANLPVIVSLLRLPGLNLMSHNRLVIWMSFSVLVLAAIGLEALQSGAAARRRWFALPAALLALLVIWSTIRAFVLPEPIATQVGGVVAQGREVLWLHTAGDVRQLQDWFARANGATALLCAIGFTGWAALLAGCHWRRAYTLALGLCLVGDLCWFACDRSAQCDPALYFPRIPLLDDVAKAPPGRVIGYGCLPANLAQSHGLRDVRGYDAIDPKRYVELLLLTAKEASATYAATQRLVPAASLAPDGIHLSPILDLLGVRYVIFRHSPPAQVRPDFAGDDYWAMINHRALPRAFVPRRAEVVTDDAARLQRLADPGFKPAEVVLLESTVALPSEFRGSATITAEIPTRVTISVAMQETAGLVVLTDLWDKGWHAYVNGEGAAILRADHALRGVVVPPGRSVVEFRYEPAAFTVGCWLSGFAAFVIATGGSAAWRRRAA